MRPHAASRTSLFAVILTLALSGCQSREATAPSPLEGAWQAERYLLKDGSEHAVKGLLFFGERDWSVLFFVMGHDGVPHQGSGEGGTYTLRGDSLVFSHRYNLSAGEAIGSLPASPLRMEVRDAAEAPREACTIDPGADDLTIFFPSGNAMTFRRRPAPETVDGARSTG